MKCIEKKPIELSDLKKAFKEIYPSAFSSYTHQFDLSNSINVFSPFQIQLPSAVLKKIQSFNVLFNKNYKHQFKKAQDQKIQVRGGLHIDSGFRHKPLVLSCLDFHVDLATKELKLIEANTNSSGYLIGSLVYKLHDLDFTVWSDELIHMFQTSHILGADKLFITDEKPEAQKMFIEFLIYKDFFKQKNYDFEIIDTQKLNDKVITILRDKTIGIYNRNTDFYLRNYPNLNQLYLDQKIEISPHPVGYDLWAHKDNLSDIFKNLDPAMTAQDVELFESMILKSGKIKDLFLDIEDAWLKRKKYFYKPSESYGGKASYKGSSISRKYFENLWTENFLAQEYFSPSKFIDKEQKEWKFDVRVYTFEEKTLFAMARVYQGQITNFGTLGGGFAPVNFY